MKGAGWEGSLKKMGTAVTGWRTQPPATQRGNDSRTLHLIFRTSPRPQPLVTAWLQPSSLRLLHTIPAKTQHDDITSEVFEGGKCNPIFVFIFLNVESRSSFSEGEKANVSPTPRKTNSGLQDESSSLVCGGIKVESVLPRKSH